jgi:hypothetical protein
LGKLNNLLNIVKNLKKQRRVIRMPYRYIIIFMNKIIFYMQIILGNLVAVKRKWENIKQEKGIL